MTGLSGCARAANDLDAILIGQPYRNARSDATAMGAILINNQLRYQKNRLKNRLKMEAWNLWSAYTRSATPFMNTRITRICTTIRMLTMSVIYFWWIIENISVGVWMK